MVSPMEAIFISALSESDNAAAGGMFPTIQCKYSELSCVKCPSGFVMTNVQKQSSPSFLLNATFGCATASFGLITFPACKNKFGFEQNQALYA